MALTHTVEDYLKQLFLALQQTDEKLLPMGQLATAMKVTPGTATTMVKAMADAGLVAYEPRSGVRLTAAGERHALNVVRRHRLVELLLVQVIGLDWSEVHAEAEVLEHAISAKVLDKIDALLGHPGFDPHGDPIAKATGQLSQRRLTQLTQCPTGKPVRIARVLGQSPEFLQALDRLGFRPGQVVVVKTCDEHAGFLTVRLADKSLANLGTPAAAKVLVEPA